MKNTDNQEVKIQIIEGIIGKFKEYELSSYQIAKLSGLSDNGITKIIERETKNPNIKTLNKIKDAIEIYEKDKHSPVTLSSLNDKLDSILEAIEFIKDRISLNEFDQEVMFQILKNSSSKEELKVIEESVRKKNSSS